MNPASHVWRRLVQGTGREPHSKFHSGFVSSPPPDPAEYNRLVSGSVFISPPPLHPRYRRTLGGQEFRARLPVGPTRSRRSCANSCASESMRADRNPWKTLIFSTTGWHMGKPLANGFLM